MQWIYLLCTHMCPDSLCMLLHCDTGWICTRQPFLHSNFLYILAGTHICGIYPHLHNGHSYTRFPFPSLQSFFIQENMRTWECDNVITSSLVWETQKYNKIQFTHLSWQQSAGRTCWGHRNIVQSIPLYNGRSRKLPPCESRSHHCDSEPGGTGSYNSATKGKGRKMRLKFNFESFTLTKQPSFIATLLYLTVLSIVSCWASAAVGAQAISAGASIFTRLRVAFILLIFTECPVKSRMATARKGVDVINASPIIQTGAKERRSICYFVTRYS